MQHRTTLNGRTARTVADSTRDAYDWIDYRLRHLLDKPAQPVVPTTAVGRILARLRALL